jgi:hypothetical protein
MPLKTPEMLPEKVPRETKVRLPDLEATVLLPAP